MNEHQDSEQRDEPGKKPGFWDVVKSTLAAALGVQSSKNRERDFQHGSLGTFIAAGVIFTVIFIAIVITVVKIVVGTAG